MKLVDLLTESTPRTLYHGTTIDALPRIRQYGLRPRLGRLTMWAYGGADDDLAPLKPLIFAADRHGLDATVRAMAHRISEIYPVGDGSLHRLRVRDFAQYGLLCVIKRGERSFEHATDNRYDREGLRHVEGDDYIRDQPIRPSAYLMGDRLVRFLDKNCEAFQYVRSTSTDIGLPQLSRRGIRELHKLDEAETLTSEQIRWWSTYAQRRVFSSEDEARAWIKHKLDLADRDLSAEVFGRNGPEKNAAIAAAMPIYRSGKGFKIGKRIRPSRPHLTWSNFDIRRPDHYDIMHTALAQSTADFDILPLREYLLNHLLPPKTKDIYLQHPEIDRIHALAQDIRANEWFEAIIVDVNTNTIIEGQHRARAARLMGFKMVPGIGIRYEE